MSLIRFCAVMSALFVILTPYNAFAKSNKTNNQNNCNAQGKNTTMSYEIICRFQQNSYVCDDDKKHIVKYYYDYIVGECRTYHYSHCPNTQNLFDTRKECWDTCRDTGYHDIPQNLTRAVFCKLQPDFGTCHDYKPMFYFDISENECRGFSWSGCKGNQNRFETLEDCSAACQRALSRYPNAP